MYKVLFKILDEASAQACHGKGKERHANGKPFEKQPICQICRDLGSVDFALGQAMKKILESRKLPSERGVAELLGAINYLAAAVYMRRELEQKEVL